MLAETSAGLVYGHPHNRDANTMPIDGLIPIFCCGNTNHVLTITTYYPSISKRELGWSAKALHRKKKTYCIPFVEFEALKGGFSEPRRLETLMVFPMIYISWMSLTLISYHHTVVTQHGRSYFIWQLVSHKKSKARNQVFHGYPNPNIANTET